jgi:hypothetical protein
VTGADEQAVVLLGRAGALLYLLLALAVVLGTVVGGGALL